MNAADLIIEDDSWSCVRGKTKLVESLISQACSQIDGPDAGSVAVLLTSDEAVADLNQRFRQKSGPTNVLSFPAAETSDNHLGDIALAWGVVKREADARGLSLQDHLAHLVLHGFLHLQGYDHQADAEAERMEALEVRILAALGIANPYAAESGAPDSQTA